MKAEPSVECHNVIRRCTLADVDFMLEVAEHRYGAKDFDRIGVRMWLIERMDSPEMGFFRGEYSTGCCHIGKRYMQPNHWQAFLTVLASKPQKTLSMEPFRICEAMVEWARTKGATKFWFSDITGHDLGAFVRHLGAREAGRNYVVDLDPEAGAYG